MDDVGHLVYDAAFIHIPDTDVNKYESQSLATKEGHLFSQLLKKGIFVQNTRLNFEGVCKVSNTVPRVSIAVLKRCPVLIRISVLITCCYFLC